MNFTLNSKRYPLDRVKIADIFTLVNKIEQPETLDEYKNRVKHEFAAYLWTVCLLRRWDKIQLSRMLRISVRSLDRYIHEIPLPDTFLEYIYTLQIYQL